MAKFKVYNGSQWIEQKFNAIDSDKLGGQLPSHYLNYNNLTNKPSEVATKTSSTTLSLSDTDKFIYANSSSAIIFTVPPNSSVAFSIGAEVHFMQYGAGAVSVAAGSGVTILSEGNKKTINAQYQVMTAKKILINTWVLFGALK